MKQRLLSFLLAFLLLCPFLPAAVFAAPTAKASISLSSSKVTVGEKITVTVSYQSSSAIGSYDFLLNYDAGLLQYESGADSESGNGKLPFVNYNENSDPKTVKRSVVFKAIATGTAKFSTQAKAIVDNDSFSLMAVTEASKSLTVDPKHTASTNNNLKTLTVSGGTYSPAFDPSVTKYTMEVDYSVKKLTVSAVAEHKKAIVSISETDLALGENTVKITVKAESGAKKTYTLTVIRKQSAFANVTTNLDGNGYVFAHDPDSIQAPAGFTATSATYLEKEVLAYQNADGFFTLVWLTPLKPPASSAPASSAPASSAPVSSASPASSAASTAAPSASNTQASTKEPAQTTPQLPPREGWYMLLSDGATLLPYVSLTSSPLHYVPIPIPTEVTLPEGCESLYVNIGGEEVRAYRNEYCTNNGLYLIFARCSDNTSAFFYWHQASGSFYPYIRPETVTITVTLPAPSTTEAAQAGATAKPSDSSPAQDANRALTVYTFVITGAFLILLAVFILWAVKTSSQIRQLRQKTQAAPKRKRPSRDPASHFSKEYVFGEEGPLLPEAPSENDKKDEE